MLPREEASTGTLRFLSSSQKDIAAISAHQRLQGMQKLCSIPATIEEEIPMRLIGLPVMCLLLVGCAIPPIFPPEIMKDVEQNSSAVKTWKEQSYHSSANFVPHKVVLAGQIMRVLTKSGGVVLLVEEEPADKYRGHDFTRVQKKDTFLYEISFRGFPDPSMLQRGNKLVVVGTTNGASQETIGSSAKVLPHLSAQCLHIWQIDELEANRFPYGDTPGYFPQERTFCDENGGSSSFTGSQVNEKRSSLQVRKAMDE